MRTLDEITEDARVGSAFANGSEYGIWSARWCATCIHEPTSCPLVDSAFLGFIPKEWTPRMTKDGEPRPGDFKCAAYKKAKPLTDLPPR